jgi:hypothetical protein
MMQVNMRFAAQHLHSSLPLRPVQSILRPCLPKRIIPALDIKDGRVVKCVKFENMRDAGDPSSAPRTTTSRRR